MKYVEFIRSQGLTVFFAYALRKLFFFFYKFAFRRCGRIFIVGSFRFTGKKFIEIGSLSLGRRIRIDAISLMNGVRFQPSIVIGHGVSFGDDIHIGCTGRVSIGNGVLGGSHIYITDHDHGIYGGDSQHSDPAVAPAAREVTPGSHVTIGDNVFIGEYVTITKDVTIGDGAVVGAMSLVTRDVPPRTIAAGNPARVIKRWDDASKRWLAVKE
jgi:lipopolysaccharide O-acetyltransferase